jgi:hypothetical protein
MYFAGFHNDYYCKQRNSYSTGCTNHLCGRKRNPDSKRSRNLYLVTANGIVVHNGCHSNRQSGINDNIYGYRKYRRMYQ